MGNAIWIVLVSLFVMLINCKQAAARKKLSVLSPLLSLKLTILIATPIVSDFRYILNFFIMAPFLLYLGNVFGIRDSRETNIEEKRIASQSTNG